MSRMTNNNMDEEVTSLVFTPASNAVITIALLITRYFPSLPLPLFLLVIS